MHSTLKDRRVVNKVLTNLVLGYNLDQEFSGHHLFPDVPVTEIGGDIIKFGKEAFMIMDTERAPGETVRGVGTTYSSNQYVLKNRLLEAITPEEFEEQSGKIGISNLARSVSRVYSMMRLEGEYHKAQLANNPDNYALNNKATLSGSDQWSDPNSDVLQMVNDAKETIRAKTGRYPNVFHLDAKGYNYLKRNTEIKKQYQHNGGKSITLDMLADYFDVEKVVVGRSVHVENLDSDFQDIWKDNSILAYVPPKLIRAKETQSFGYNYVHKGFPKVEKEYFSNDDRSWHNPVLFRDKAVLTDNGAGFLFMNTTG